MLRLGVAIGGCTVRPEHSPQYSPQVCVAYVLDGSLLKFNRSLSIMLDYVSTFAYDNEAKTLRQIRAALG